MRLTGDHQKYFRKIPQFSVFFLNFFLFFAVSSWARMVFETYAYPFGYFRRCKIDEILMSFYPWFSPYDISFLVFFKISQVFAKHGFASVSKTVIVSFHSHGPPFTPSSAGLQRVFSSVARHVHCETVIG